MFRRGIAMFKNLRNVNAKFMSFVLVFALFFGSVGAAFAEENISPGDSYELIVDESLPGENGEDIDAPDFEAPGEATDPDGEDLDEENYIDNDLVEEEPADENLADENPLDEDPVDEGSEQLPEGDSDPMDGEPAPSSSRENESSGMKLSASMVEAKSEMAAMGMAEAVSRMEGDRDYVKYEIICLTESEDEAKKVAKAYKGALVSFSEGVALIKVAADIVEILEKAETPGNGFPAVYPNFIYALSSEDIVDGEIDLAGANTEENSFDEDNDDGATGESVDEGIEGDIVEGGDEGIEEDTGESGDEGLESGEEGTENSSVGPPSPPDEDALKEVGPDTNPAEIKTFFERNVATQKDIDLLDAKWAPMIIDEEDLQSADSGMGAFAVSPNDPYVGYQWHLSEIGAFDAWQYSKGNNVKVAVIDSGIWSSHPDLKNNIIGAYNTCSFALNKSKDNSGHGTHVAGIIAAQAGNKRGVSGVAPKAKLISIKAFDLLGVGYEYGSSADIARAVNLAVSKGAQVINMSFGNYYSDIALERSITKATKKGVVIVASAGGGDGDAYYDGENLNTYPFYPALYPNVICVSATTYSGGLAYYSGYGAGKITLGAPGGNKGRMNNGIASTYKVNSYSWRSGSSMAAAVVTGVVALLLAQNSAYRNGKSLEVVRLVTEQLKKTAKNSSPYNSSANFGAGRVDAAAATWDLAGATAAKPVFNVGGSGVSQAGNTIVTTNANGVANVGFTGGGPGAVYYYTTNGKNPTLGAAKGSSVVLNANGKTSVTLKAVSCINGKLSPVKAVTYKLDARMVSITLKPKSGAYSGTTVAAVGLGKKLTLTPVFAPTKPANKALAWSSSNKAVASVDKKGIVTAKGVGNVTIYVSNARSGVSSSIGIQVFPLTKSISLSAKSVTLGTEAFTLGGTPVPTNIRLVATPNPAGALSGSGNFTWKSSKPKVAAVDESGMIRAGSPGKATITVTARDGSGKKITCAVKVIKPARISYVSCKQGQTTGNSYVVGLGKTINLKAVLEDKTASNSKVVWKSDNPAVATVSGGKVKGISIGTTSVKVSTADGIIGAARNITITVKPATGSLKKNLSKKTLRIPGEDSFTWTVSNSTAGAHSTQYAYTVKNKKVASVDGIGSTVTINAKGKGTTTITAKAVDGSGKKASVKVTVKKMVTSVWISYTGYEGIAYGKKIKFKANVYPSDASNKKVNWFVDNSNFRIDSKGNLSVKNRAGIGQSTRVFCRPKDGYISLPVYVGGGTVVANARWIRAYSTPVKSVYFGMGSSYSPKKIKSYKMTEGTTTTSIRPYYKSSNSYGSYAVCNASSSNYRVADLVWNESRREWRLEAYAPGKATIKVVQLDGTKKTAKLKVTVKAKGDTLF